MSQQELTPDQEFDQAFAQASTPTKAQPEAEPKPEPEKQEPPANEPAEPAKDELTPDPQAEPKPQDQQPKQDDGIAELRRQLSEAQHRERSSANRVSHFMRESNQLADQVKQLRAEIEQLKAAPKAPAADPGADADLDDALAEAPGLKAAVERRINKATQDVLAKLGAAEKRLAEVGEKADRAVKHVEPLVDREQQQQAAQVFGALDKQFDGWRQTVKSTDFHGWLGRQPAAVRAMYEQGSTFDEAATVLKLFHASTGAPKQNQQPAGDGGKPAEDAGKGAANKNERLREAAGIAPRSVARVSTKKDDFEGAFEEFTAQTKR